MTEAFFSKNKVTKARIRELDQVPRHKKLIRKTSENQRQFWARKIRTWRRRRVRITRDLVGHFYTGQTPQAAWEYVQSQLQKRARARGIKPGARG